MTPPMASHPGDPDDLPEAALPCALMVTLTQRADFLRAASAKRQATPGFTLQARARGDGTQALRVGYTCSRKIGNAVARNRAKRRLREVARTVLPAKGLPGWDYVLVGRPKVTIDREFSALLADLHSALMRLHGGAA